MTLPVVDWTVCAAECGVPQRQPPAEAATRVR